MCLTQATHCHVSAAAGRCSQRKSSKKPLYLLSTKQQTDSVCNELVNIVELVSAEGDQYFPNGFPGIEQMSKEHLTTNEKQAFSLAMG